MNRTFKESQSKTTCFTSTQPGAAAETPNCFGNDIAVDSIMDRRTPQRGNEQLALGNALGNQRQKYIRPDGAKTLLHTDM